MPSLMQMPEVAFTTTLIGCLRVDGMSDLLGLAARPYCPWLLV